MLKKVLSFREQLFHFTDVFRLNLRFDEVPKSAGLGSVFIQINQDLVTGGNKGVNRNRIAVHEINPDRGFNLSAHSFQLRDLNFALIQFGCGIEAESFLPALPIFCPRLFEPDSKISDAVRN